MRTMLIIIMFLIASPVFGSEAGPDQLDWKSMETLDLVSAKSIALAQNPSLEAAVQRVAQARQQVKQATSAYWPQLDLSGSAAHVDMSDNSYDANLAQAKAINPFAKIYNPEDYNSAGLKATWLLFNGFEREYSHKAAKYGTRAGEHGLQDAKRLILSAVVQAYYNALLAKEDIRIAEADAAFNQRLMKEAHARLDLGAGSLSDALNFEIAVHGATAQLINGSRAYEIAMLGLGAVLGINDPDFAKTVKIPPLEKESEKDMTTPDAEALLQVAETMRPDIQQAKASVDQARASIGAAKAKFYPTIAASVSRDVSRENDSGYEGEDVEQTAALSFSYNLFAGGLHRAGLAKAKAAKREAEAGLNQALIDAASDVRTSAATVEFTQKQLALQNKTAILVRENRDLVEKEYQAGQASLVRLNEAQKDLIQVESNLARVRVQLRQAWFQLLTSTGQSLEQ